MYWKYKETDITIGYLFFDNIWLFKYNDKTINQCIKLGFRPFPDLSAIDKIYPSKKLFQVFNIRYMVRNDIEYMKKNNGSLETDKVSVKYMVRT